MLRLKVHRSWCNSLYLWWTWWRPCQTSSQGSRDKVNTCFKKKGEIQEWRSGVAYPQEWRSGVAYRQRWMNRAAYHQGWMSGTAYDQGWRSEVAYSLGWKGGSAYHQRWRSEVAYRLGMDGWVSLIRDGGVGQHTHNCFFFLAAVNVHLWKEKAPLEKNKKKMLRVVLLRQNKMENGLMGEWL